MRIEQGQVAVITGAAGGIGRGLAEEGGARGLRLVLTDVDGQRLSALTEQLQGLGVTVVSQVADVSDAAQVDALRDLAVERFGGVDLLFNNAGVLQTGFSWEIGADRWQRLLDINLGGVINGIRSFIPLLLGQQRPAQVVNTASLAGLVCSPMLGPYTVSKQAVVALSETLHYELAVLQAQVSVAVLCPGPVASDIMNSNQAAGAATGPLDALLDSSIRQGMEPRELAREVFAGIEVGRFWLLPHKNFKPALERRLTSILDETNPVFQMADA
ncbi:SDR family NAD(P)-dependent oxidoreductase [Metapseudomonas lalkuanensis]|uniref:SDR family NAD(P)-dependent oxidoreductase n=1 Tax=Metapseudomonas lalkuanensis TaxID=2604832 RepID=UPI001CF4D498|nr:SDR family NAD(P)-dependent oxidoreductase [Pseudomonas lalkuanensis]UCO99346.1 SDR family NAD(P)-dependent oxidoreductase [Pseudomonas lalkuanensis]